LETLFRKEAIEARQSKFLTDAKIPAPLSHKVLLIFFLACGCLLIVGAVTAKYARTVYVEGQVITTGGGVRVESGNFGVVEDILVKEGNLVHAGDVLINLNSGRHMNGRALETRFIESLEVDEQELLRQMKLAQEVHVARIDSLARKKRQYEQDIRASTNIISATQRQLEIILSRIKRVESSQHRQAISQLELERFKTTAIDSEKQLISESADLTRLQRQHDDIDVELDEADFMYTKNLFELSRELKNLQRQRDLYLADLSSQIVAPINGTVTSLEVAPGQYVERGAVLLSIISSEVNFGIELCISASAVSNIKVGDLVRVSVNADVSEELREFGASVSDLANVQSVSRDTRNNEGCYNAFLAIDRQDSLSDQQKSLLRAGMPVSAGIQTDKKTIISWMLDAHR